MTKQKAPLQRHGFDLGRIAIAAGLGALFAGCAPGIDPTAVQKYAQTVADASTSFDAIAADFGASCLRRRDVALLLPAAYLGTQEKHAQFVLAPGYGPSSPPSQEPSPSAPPVVGGIDCTSAAKISTEWAKANSVILAYPHELGAIAAVDAVPSPNPSPLLTELVSTKALTSAGASAVSKLSSDIAGFAIAGEQRQQIHDLVVSADPSISVAIPALENVDAAYSAVLYAEYGQVEGTYETILGQELAALSKATPTDQYLLEHQIAQQRADELTLLETINSHRAATIAYASVLEDLLKTHKALLQSATGRATLKDYYDVLNKAIPDAYQDVEALRKAVK